MIIRQLASRARLRVSCVCLVAVCLAHLACGQNYQTVVAEGYITSVEGPNEFSVNGREVLMNGATSFGVKGAKKIANAAPGHNAVQVGAWVQVLGFHNGKHEPVTANKVLFREDKAMQLAGIAVILRVISRGAEPLFEADGYRIKIVPATSTELAGTLKKLDGVKPGTWLRYEGERGQGGVVVATKAKFFPPDSIKYKKHKGRDKTRQHVQPPQFGPGKLESAREAGSKGKPAGTTKDGSIPLGVRGYLHKIPADRALQERVQRIGMRLVPEYQKQLADGDPSKIKFEFYAVDYKNLRSEICLEDGLIVVPQDVLKRVQNDDQLAAVLADGIARELQGRAARIAAENPMVLMVEVAGLAAGAFNPEVYLATEAGMALESKSVNTAVDDERARSALALMDDAGFDPRQAPEAWRLLAPKKLRKSAQSLPYPAYAIYQCRVLRLQYSGRRGAAAQAAGAGTNHK